jgi:hypothetical protein
MKYLPCRPRIEPWRSEHLDLEKPLLREVFRDLDVTSRYTLKPISDGLKYRVASSVRVYRVTKLKKREKRKNRPKKWTKIDQNSEKSTESTKISPVK